MSKAVTHEASLAAETHILTPARKAGAHPATQVYLDGESLMLGVPDDHPQYQQAMNQEFGTQTAPAGGQVRHSIRTNLEAAQQSFAAGLEHAGQTTKWGRS